MGSIQDHIISSVHAFAPEGVLAATLLLIIVADLLPATSRPAVSLGLALGGLAVSAVTVVRIPAGETLIFAGMLATDGFAATFKLVAAAVTAVVLVVSYRATDVNREHFAEYCAMAIALCLGAYVMAAAANLLSMFLAFELVSMSSYILTAHMKEDRKASEAALKYVVFSASSSAVMLYGMSLIYGLTGTLVLKAIMPALAGNTASLAQSVGVLFVLAGLTYKIAAVPYHFWCPDVYEGAPAPVAAFLSVGPKAAGMAMLARFLNEALFLPPGSPIRSGIDFGNWQTAIVLISAVTMTLGNLSALRQTNVKRLLAYSSIAHAGYMLMALAVIRPFGVTAMTFYVVAYALMNLGAFLVVIALGRSMRSEELDSYAGLGGRAPVVAVLMAIFLFSLAGIPPTMGFVGKLYLFWAVLEGKGLAWLAVVAALNTVIALYYYARILRQMFFLPAREGAGEIRVEPIHYVVLFLLAIPTLALGVYWGPLWGAISAAGTP
ncbi:MAG TPA: NADH-quinone oxidoreductase subunit N [Candidatus Latescibacteria bacterium]|nr:NADH-quinone oxidoreductase subunit N [Candidatus Latescibacterota bacterium]